MIRILLADDHTLFRESLALQLRGCPDIEHVLETGNARTAVQLFSEHRPDLVLLDVDLSDGKAFEAARGVRHIDHQARIVFVSGRLCDTDVEEALALPAQGFILGHDSFDAVSQGIGAVLRGEQYFSESLRHRLAVVDGRLRICRPCSPTMASLTPRERQLLIHLSRGASLKQAAALMAVSYKTADNQKASLMRKLDIHDRVALCRFAIHEGLVGLHSHEPALEIGRTTGASR